MDICSMPIYKHLRSIIRCGILAQFLLRFCSNCALFCMLQESMKNESHGLLQVADMQIWYKKQFLNLV